MTTEVDGLFAAEGTVKLGIVLDPSFEGSSVKIIARRDEVADAPYPCKSYAEQCFNFDASGKLLDEDGESPGKLDGLCPSSDVPVAYWKFGYQIHTRADCDGEVLNAEGNPYNFVCYDAKDLNAWQYPNASYGVLLPGENAHSVICFEETGSKRWDFDVCEDRTEDAERYDGVLRLDCGCQLDAQYNTCSCAKDPAYLPPECTVSADNDCQVVCVTDSAPDTGG